jgi:hemolysin activation/secretion protein
VTKRPAMSVSTASCAAAKLNGMRFTSCFRRYAAVSAVTLLTQVALSPSALAQTPDSGIPRFPITAYRILGNTLLPPERVQLATQPFEGPTSDFETIQRALEALEKAYVSAGFGSVKVELPEQEIDSGIVTLQVVEGTLGAVQVEPNEFFDAANVRNSLPALRAGAAVNIFELNRNLVLANESGSKVTNVTFKRNANNRDVDVEVKLVGEDPERWITLLDNSGDANTGYFRLGVVYQNANLFNRDHAVSLQVMTSPDHVEDVNILGLSYRIPVYSWGGTLDFNASHSSVNSGQITQAGGGANLAISGSGEVYGVRYTHNLDSSAERQSKFNVGLDQRFYGNNLRMPGTTTSLVPNLTTQPFILGYSTSWRMPVRETSLSVNYLKNIPGGSNGSTEDFNQSGGRLGAKAAFETVRLNISHTERFASQWQFKALFASQFTEDMLIAPEQFGITGGDGVRGFAERDVANDQGMRLNLEWWAPAQDFAQWRVLPLFFVDNGVVKRNQPQPGELEQRTIGSVGLGLRAAYGRSISSRMDFGYVTQGADAAAGSTGAQAGDTRLHFSLLYVF